MDRVRNWAPAAAQMAAIFVFSSFPRLPSLPVGLAGYTGHFIGYALLGALATRGFARAQWTGVSSAAGWRALLLSTAYGITDEFHQSFVPGRTPTVSDWCADTFGAAFGIALVMWVARRVGRHGEA
jgi:VanZ family protein